MSTYLPRCFASPLVVPLPCCLEHVSPTLGTPIYAQWLCGIIAAVLACVEARAPLQGTGRPQKSVDGCFRFKTQQF